jgi:enoyl-CoA hydratase
MTFKNLVIENHEPGIRVIKIARREALNALNSATLEELHATLTDASRDATVRVVILTGEGEKSFIAGADIAEMKDKTIGEGTRFSQLGHEVTRLLELMPKPTIAAVNGYALCGGTEMAISCDFIVASHNATFAQPEVGLGIIPGFGATLRLSKFVGLPRAKELIFSGRRITGTEAFEMGLANHVLPAVDFLHQVIEMARKIALNSAFAVSQSKRLLNDSAESVGLNYKLDSEAHAFGQIFGTPDQREGMTAFTEKRKPKFQGIPGETK